jgi:uncharacterized protein YrrD
LIRSVSDVRGYAIHATDGDLGKLDEFYFDDDTWTIRYLVVQTGTWLSDRRVLISPISVRQADWQNQRIVVSLTQDQIQHSPDIDTDRPISRQHEVSINQFYGWEHYWLGSGIWGSGMNPGDLWIGLPPISPVTDVHQKPKSEAEQVDQHDTHLRSTREVVGYHIRAKDGEIGHAEDFLFDDESWRIQSMLVDTSNWWFGKKVIVSTASVKSVS